MINRIKTWIENWREEQEQDRFKAGFGWAMAAYFVEACSCSDIEAVSVPHGDPFNRGARHAVTTIRQIIDDAAGVDEPD